MGGLSRESCPKRVPLGLILSKKEEWEYLVMAMNKAGEGEPSNVVMAVL